MNRFLAALLLFPLVAWGQTFGVLSECTLGQRLITDGDGVLLCADAPVAAAEENVQSDWNETNSSAD